MSGARTIRIHYDRPPDQHDVFEQRLVHEPGDHHGVPAQGPGDPDSAPDAAPMGRLADGYVTLMPEADIREPMVVDGRTVLEPGSPVVWVTFPGAWHDIGRFHTRDGLFTGYYANVLTPVDLRGDDWHTTDLFLDVFLPPAGHARVLDADELDDALSRGWVDRPTAERAMAEARRLVALAEEGVWPPAIAREWTLDRARAAAAP